jgi:hypothetical protein
MSMQALLLKVKAASNTRTVALLGIIAAVTMPFLMLTVGGREANNLPWYVWTIIPLLLLLVIGTGFLMFRRVSHEAEDISIRPRHH